MTTEERKKMGLVGFRWGVEIGVVDLQAEQPVFRTQNKYTPYCWVIPHVRLYDRDFARALDPAATGVETPWAEATQRYAVYENLITVLLSPAFPFADRLTASVIS